MAQSSDFNTNHINIEKKPSQDSSNLSYDCLKCNFNKKTNSKLNTICHCLLNNTKSTEHSKRTKDPLKLPKKRSFFKTLSSSFSSGHSSSIDSTSSQTKPSNETTFTNLNSSKEHHTNATRTSKNSHKYSHTNLNNKSESLVSVNWSNLDYDKDDFEEAFRCNIFI
jgi:hypothetical protein